MAMRRYFDRDLKTVVVALVGLVLLAVGSARAGDSLYGTVTTVKSGNLVTINYGAGQYDVRIAGIEVPREGAVAKAAQQFVAKLVLNKKARVRLDTFASRNVMVARLFTADKTTGIREVSVELLRAGLAQRAEGYDEKYGELAAAERDAQKARRGLWSNVRPNQ